MAGNGGVGKRYVGEGYVARVGVRASARTCTIQFAELYMYSC